MSDDPHTYDLFSYPHTPGFVKGSDTSEAAAASIPADTLRAKVYAKIFRTGPAGMTCDECEVEMRGRHQTISARIRELVLGSSLVDTGRRRFTRSGRQAAVYVAPMFLLKS